MTDQRDRGGRLPSRRLALALAAVPLVAILIADLAVLGHRDRPHRPHAVATPRPTTSSTDTQAERRALTARTTAIRQLLHRRSHAVLHHDLAQWMSVLDPAAKRFRAREKETFRNLHDVSFASWNYDFSPTRQQLPNRRTRHRHAATFLPSTFVLHYRLRGFDRRPTSLQQYPTFVHRGGQWFLASFTDFAKEGMASSRDLWDFGPVAVVRTPQVLVLGHPAALTLMHEIAGEVAADIPRVTSVWGRHWSRRVVVLVPATQHELGRVVGDPGKLDQIAAVATAEVSGRAGRPDPVGDRIGINPSNWPKLSFLGRQIVLTHELTHVATRRLTSASTPKWLAEGFADYVGYLGSGVPTTFVAQELRRDVVAGDVPARLPTNRQFRGGSGSLSQAYEGGWLACRLIAQRYGQRALVRFYAAVGRSRDSTNVAVEAAFNHVLHTSLQPFVRQWRGYLRAQLG